MKENNVTVVDVAEERGQGLSSLTKASACGQSQSFAFEGTDFSQGEIYYETAIIKSAIRYALMYRIKEKTVVLKKDGSKDIAKSRKAYEKAVMEYMMGRYAEVPFKNYQQRQEQLLWDHRRVMRYLHSEAGREISFPEGGTVEVAGKKRFIRPDIAVTCGTPGTDKDASVELIFFKNSKPKFSQTGRKNEFNRDVQLFAAVLYGRQLGYKYITASFYFLKFASDSGAWAGCRQGFFNNGSDNVVEMEDIFFGKPNALDEQMDEKLQTLEKGVEPEKMLDEECEYCKHYDLCKYTLPALRIGESEEEASEEDAEAEEKPKITPSPQQQEVIDVADGVTRVIAAAGSGKTATVSARVAKLIKDGCNPAALLCITFSNGGAKEMYRKISRELGFEPEGIKIITFHALMLEIAKANWEWLGYSRPMGVIGDVQKYSIIADLLGRFPILEWRGKSFLNFTPSKGWANKGALAIVADIFSQIKASGKEPSDITSWDIRYDGEAINAGAVGKVIKLYEKYESVCKERGLVDYDDMELLAFKVIEEKPDFLASTYEFEHIIVDEFQDTSAWQMEFVKHLKMLPTFKSLMVVGDDAQSIYGFRKTSPEYILNFEDYLNAPFNRRTSGDTDLPDVREDEVRDIVLGDNYRSKQEILDIASTILKRNVRQIDKQITAARGGDGQVVVNGHVKLIEELKWIVRGIQGHHDHGVRYEDIAVLAYTKDELRRVMDALTKEGIPSMFGAPEPVADNPRIKAILAFARVILNEKATKDAATCANALNQGGLMHLPTEEVEDRVQEVVELAKGIARNQNPVVKKEMFLKFIEDIALNDETVEHFVESFEHMDFDEMLKHCRDFDLYGAAEEFRRLDEYPGVKLITAHSSKGLEWPIVYLTLDKFTVTGFNRDNVEETRRLLFVAMTRARDELYVTGVLQKTGKDGKSDVDNVMLRETYEAAGLKWDPYWAEIEYQKEQAKKKASPKKSQAKPKAKGGAKASSTKGVKAPRKSKSA